MDHCKELLLSNNFTLPYNNFRCVGLFHERKQNNFFNVSLCYFVLVVFIVWHIFLLSIHFIVYFLYCLFIVLFIHCIVYSLYCLFIVLFIHCIVYSFYCLFILLYIFCICFKMYIAAHVNYGHCKLA